MIAARVEGRYYPNCAPRRVYGSVKPSPSHLGHIATPRQWWCWANENVEMEAENIQGYTPCAVCRNKQQTTSMSVIKLVHIYWQHFPISPTLLTLIPDTEGPESVATAVHADDREKQYYCRYPHPTDTEGPESVPTAVHADDREKQHSCRYPHPTDTEGPESVATAAHA